MIRDMTDMIRPVGTGGEILKNLRGQVGRIKISLDVSRVGSGQDIFFQMSRLYRPGRVGSGWVGPDPNREK